MSTDALSSLKDLIARRIVYPAPGQGVSEWREQLAEHLALALRAYREIVFASLADPDEPHIVVLNEDGFNMQHPLIERVTGTLFDCELHLELNEDGPGDLAPGRYEVHQGVWTPTEGEPDGS